MKSSKAAESGAWMGVVMVTKELSESVCSMTQ